MVILVYKFVKTYRHEHLSPFHCIKLYLNEIDF